MSFHDPSALIARPGIEVSDETCHKAARTIGVIGKKLGHEPRVAKVILVKLGLLDDLSISHLAQD